MAHKTSNVTGKVPDGALAEIMNVVHSAYYARNRQSANKIAEAVLKTYQGI